MKKDTIKNIVILILLLCVFFLFNPKCKRKSVSGTQSVIKWSSNGISHAKTYALDLKSKDKELVALKKQVKSYKNKLKSATTLKTLTKIDTFILTDTAYKYVLNLKDSKGKTWISGDIQAFKDCVKIKQFIFNEYAVVIGEEYQGLFKVRKPYAEVLNYNPFTETTALKTYQVTLPKSKRVSAGLNISYGINSQLKPDIYIGVGMQYNLINIK